MTTRKLIKLSHYSTEALAIRTALMEHNGSSYDLNRAYLDIRDDAAAQRRDNNKTPVTLILEDEYEEHLGILKGFPFPTHYLDAMAAYLQQPGGDTIRDYRLMVPKAANVSEVDVFDLTKCTKGHGEGHSFRVRKLFTKHLFHANIVDCRYVVVITPGELVRMVNIIDDLVRLQNSRLVSTPDIFVDGLYDVLDTLKLGGSYYSGAVVYDCYKGSVHKVSASPTNNRVQLSMYPPRLCFDEHNQNVGVMVL